jgi:hypothetical protein
MKMKTKSDSGDSMTTFMSRLFLVLALCVPGSLHAQGIQQRAAPQSTNSRYVLFIHAGPKKPDDSVVKKIAGTLAQKGYSVRAPDGEVDNVGGSGVDYFADTAQGVAQDVANTVNKILKDEKLLEPDKKGLEPRSRAQRTKNPPTYLGVWLFNP